MDDKQKMYEKNRKHSEALNFRVDKKTYLELTLIAKQRGISRADVCRERLKGLKYEPPLLAEDDRVVLTKQLNQIGNNLNQAVKALNIIAKYFREESEDKKEKSLHFSFDASRYNIFKDELANSIAKKLMISYPDDIFLESNRSAPSFFK
ncbi:TPA: plasmid mobilization relaxosome protein MobC, partial [Enterococcus faecium]